MRPPRRCEPYETRLEDLGEGPVLRDDVVVRGDGECDPPPFAVHDRCWRRLVDVEEVRTNGCVAASRAAEPVEDQIVERPGGEPVVGGLNPRGSEELRAREEGHGGSRGRREFVGADGPGGRGVKYGQQRGAELGTVERERGEEHEPRRTRLGAQVGEPSQLDGGIVRQRRRVRGGRRPWRWDARG